MLTLALVVVLLCALLCPSHVTYRPGSENTEQSQAEPGQGVWPKKPSGLHCWGMAVL